MRSAQFTLGGRILKVEDIAHGTGDSGLKRVRPSFTELVLTTTDVADGRGSSPKSTWRDCYYKRSGYSIASNRRGMSPMAEVGSPTSRRARAWDSYVNQWNRFVASSQASGRRSTEASPGDVAARLDVRSETRARP